MEIPAPTCDLERVFCEKAAALPISEADIGRNTHGILHFFWASPCEDLGGLSLYVSEYEIVLGTNDFHTHHDSNTYYGQDLSDDELHVRIVEAAIAEALEIMRGEKVFTTSYDSNGNPTSFGMRPLVQSEQAKELEKEHERMFPDIHARRRRWTWFGELAG